MKYLLLLTLLIFSQVMFAQNNVINADLIESHYASKNFVWNSGAEKNKNLITESASITTRSTSTPLEGSASFAIDGTADDQTVCFNSKTIDSVYKNKNFQAQFYFSGDASLYKAYVKIGSDKITSDVTLTNETVSKEVNFNFPSGDLSTSPVVCIETTAAGAAAIKVDKVYLGPAFNLQNVNQSSFVGSAYFATTASCNWSRTNAALGAFSTTAACPGPTLESNPGPEVISTTDTDLPKVTLSNLRPGTYKVLVELMGYVGTTSNIATYTISDGTNSSGSCSGTETSSNNDFIPCTLVGNFNYSSSQSTITFEVFGAAQAGTVNISNAAGLVKTKFSIYYIPSASQLALTSQLPSAPTVQIFTSGSGTYTKPIGVKYIRVRMVGGGGGGGGSATSAGNNGGTGGTGGNTTFGTSLLTANGGAGGAGTSQAAGGAGGTATISSPAYGTARDGSIGDSTQETNLATVILGGRMGGATWFGGGGPGGPSVAPGYSPVANTGSGGGGGGAPSAGIAGSGGGSGGQIDAIIPNPSSTYTYAIGAAGTAGAAGTGGQVGGAGAAGYIEVTEYYNSDNAPLLVGSVTSNSSGAERIERASIGTSSSTACTASPCAYVSQSGSWISSVTRSGVGAYTVNFTAGVFSSAPTCTCSARDSGGGFLEGCSPDIPTTSSVVISTLDYATPTSRDGFIQLHCMGTR